MDRRGQGATRVAAPQSTDLGPEKKTPPELIQEFDRLWSDTRPAFAQQRTWQRARVLALGALMGLGRRTVTGMLTTTGQQFVDWSAAYRLFNRARFDPEALMAPARRSVIDSLDRDQPLVVLMDHTLVPKRGRKVAGTSWRRDPLGPPFCNNFIWAQRFLQLSAALPDQDNPSRARAIPIAMAHCPTPRKPRRNAPEQAWVEYHQTRQETKISTKGLEQIVALRKTMDQDGQRERILIVPTDGDYTNGTVIRPLPERTVLIGRMRKDAKLYELPTEPDHPTRGRKRIYGTKLPTPEQMRRDESIPWQTVQAFAAGKVHDFQVKSVGPVRWRASGQRNLRLLIIRPLAYRPTKHGPTLYRNPVYLVSTDPDLPLADFLQFYVWRWEIEVNFRDQKTLLGTGQAQVRNPSATERVPVFIAAAYAYLHLAVDHLAKHGSLDALPTPKWRRRTPPKRTTSAQAINLLRTHAWARALGLENISDFARHERIDTKPQKIPSTPVSAILYATG